MKAFWLVKTIKSNMFLPDRGSSQLEMKNASDQRVHPHVKVGYSSQQTHISPLCFLISLQDACQRVLSSINPEEDLHKRKSKTAPAFFHSLSCYFLTLKNSLALIVLASGKEAWQIGKPSLLLVR